MAFLNQRDISSKAHTILTRKLNTAPPYNKTQHLIRTRELVTKDFKIYIPIIILFKIEIFKYKSKT